MAVYTASDASFLQQAADQIAPCIENLCLYRKKRRVKQEWEETFKAVTDMLVVGDQDFRVVRFNKATAELGKEHQNPLRVGQKCRKYFHPEQR